MSGLNFVPISSGTTNNAYIPIAPSSDLGNEGDYAIDLNTNILYGPKDSSALKIWPLSSKLSLNLYFRGSWAGWLQSSYFDGFVNGDIVHDSLTGSDKNYYVCVKSHGRVPSSSGPWFVGDYFISKPYGTFTGIFAQCIKDTNVSYDQMVIDNNNQSNTWDIFNYWNAGYPNDILYLDANGIQNWQLLSSSTIGINESNGIAPTQYIVRDGSINTTQLANSTGLSDGVTSAKLATSAVTTAKIADTNVTFGKLASAAIASSSDTSSSKLVIASDSRLSDGRTPDYNYVYVSTNSFSLTYYLIPAGQTFTELGTGLGITEIRLPTAAPSSGQVFCVRNGSSVSISIKNNLGGTIVWSGGSGTSFTLAAGATAMLVYAGANNFIRLSAFDASQITNGTLDAARLPSSVVLNSSPTINTPTIDSGATGTTTFAAGTQTAFTIQNYASNLVPLINFNSSSQIVGARFNTAGALFYGGSGSTSTTVVGSATGTATVTLPGSTGTIALTSDNITGTSAGISSGSIAATGAISMPYRAISAARTLDATDYTIDCTGGPYSVTLPSAATAGAGRIYNIKNSGTGTITIARAGTDTIDGVTSITMNGSIKQYQTITLQSTGSAWIIL
jgi:hypothetical protein